MPNPEPLPGFPDPPGLPGLPDVPDQPGQQDLPGQPEDALFPATPATPAGPEAPEAPTAHLSAAPTPQRRSAPGVTDPSPLEPLAAPPLAAPAASFQSELTFRANVGVGRHGWLRLTPAYGVRMVRERLEYLPPGSVVTDPFSGTGTTPLAAAEARMTGQALDINPFLLWLGRAKTAHYSPAQRAAAQDAVRTLGEDVRATLASPEGRELPWTPPVAAIDRWWSPGTLAALAHLRAGIDALAEPPGASDDPVRNLLEVGLCRTVIACSGAAFNHQSMSFRTPAAADQPPEAWEVDAQLTLTTFAHETAQVLATLTPELEGSATFHQGDARSALGTLLADGTFREADLLLTSPPYCNRMSYVRELRPYMYWTRHLRANTDGGELDWRAIGGTWGAATSRLRTWEPETDTPVDAELTTLGEAIRTSGEATGKRNGPAMATYVHRYHHDLWLHLQDALPAVRRGGQLVYVVGNSTFFGHDVPVQEHLATMLRALGARDVDVSALRKRSSKAALYEYAVRATR